ncbi:MAG: trypsin-like peptidase domain-containing protein [Comamonadaceae bacterium]|nr:trypsin-like peptidase domain-containing protein [Comamonadaceae bacterium]
MLSRIPASSRLLCQSLSALLLTSGVATLLASPVSAMTTTLELGSLPGRPAANPRLLQVKTVQQPSAHRIPAHVIALPALEVAKSALAPAEAGMPLQIGVGRTVEKAGSVEATSSLLHWHRTAEGGMRAALAVQSPDAKFLRMGLRVEQLPPGSVLRVYAPDDESTVEIQALEVLNALQNNLDAGAQGDEAYTYWLPSVSGQQAVLEIQLPPGMAPHLLKVSVPSVSHIALDPAMDDPSKALSGSCNVDVMCTSGHDAHMSSVAHMRYTKGDGRTYICSGSLMNNTRQDYTPYFLTANHCISTQVAASSLETFWNYRANRCNSSQLHPSVTQLSGGAQLLWASADTDTALLRLRNSPPESATYAGWNAQTPGMARVFSIHHPGGDLQKYSEGAIFAYGNCRPTSAEQFSCSEATANNSAYVGVRWTRGTTEGGSSGGPLFSNSGQIIGQLYGGTGNCETPDGFSIYGRFDLAFRNALNQWLAPAGNTRPTPTPTPTPTPGARAPVFRFYNASTGAHFYTNNTLERDFVIANYKAFQYEGPRFYAVAQPAPGTSPVFRFFNTSTGAHFYTINAAERDFVIAQYPAFKYEGPAWHAQTSSGNQTSPMHRFYNTSSGTHFYTINAQEAEFVRANYPVFRYEGVAYHAWPQQ